MAAKIRAIIFDCFGVVVGKGFKETYRSAGGNPEADNQFIADLLYRANLGLISEDQFHRAVAGQLHISLDEWQGTVRRAEQPDTELLNYIAELRQSYKTAILSNANRGVLPRKIGDEWLKKCFDTVVVSAEVGTIKPDPGIYHYTADALGVQPAECIFFDDHERYTQAADEVGMHGIVYQNLAQARAAIEALTAAT